MLLSVLLLHWCFLVGKAVDEGASRAIENDNCTRYLLQIPKDRNYLTSSRHDFNVVQTGTKERSPCPPWYHWSEGNCTKGRNVLKAVTFQRKTGQPWLEKFYCMTTDENETNKIGGCLTSFFHQSFSRSSTPLPCNISKLNEYMCGGLNREGQLCGRCVKGFAPPVYSYSLRCVNCTDYHLNWLKYIGVAFGPLTLFCLLICLFHISATSPYLHGFVFACEMISSHTFVRLIVNSNDFNPSVNGKSLILLSNLYQGLVSIWNLDFFSEAYEPFCLNPHMTIVEALALNYLIGLYPLLLVIVVFLLVKMYSKGVTLLVKLWRPFTAVLRPFLRSLHIQTSLIESFATLYFLSAMKIQSVSIDLLTPTTLYFVNGTISDTYYLYLAGDVDYFGKRHLPYAVLALLLLTFFTLFPVLLLFLYPCRFFQQFLNSIRCNFVTLRTFMDVFQGNYKDGTNNTRDLRFFSGMFFCARFIIVAGFLLLNSSLFWMIFAATITTLGFSIAVFRPQKTFIHYVLDLLVLMMLSLVVFFIIGLTLQDTNSISRKINNAFRIIALSLPILYIILLMGYWVCVRNKFLRHLQKYLGQKCSRCFQRFSSKQRSSSMYNII